MNKLNFVTPGLVLCGLVAVGQAYALDTDIYLKSQSLSRNDAPRVLIIFDNSGSMATPVTETRVPYDPNVDYCSADLDTLYGIAGANAGKPGGCASRAGRIYWSFSNPRQPPAPSSSDWFDTSKNRCLSSTLATTGTYSGTKIAKWRSGSSGGGWRSLSGASNTSITYVDCEADGATNGQTAADGTQPRSSNSTAYGPPFNSSNPAFNWNNFTSNTGPTLYTSNYMNFWHNPALVTTRTRLAIAQGAVTDVVDSNPSFWLGLMAFNVNDGTDSNQNNEHGGRVVHKILDLNTPGLRTQYKAHINNLGADTWTPLAETMWEAYRYWAGLSVDYGDNNNSNIAPPRDNNAQNPPGSGPYISPFEYACQTGYIVYITDGDPTRDSAADSKIKSLSGLSSSNCAHSDSTPGTSCLKDLAGWMHDNDVYPSLPGEQTVKTYTIGFGNGMSADGRALLDETARRGGGQFFTAQNADELTIALQSIFVQILAQTTSFTAPSLSINAFNRQFNRDEIYLSLFKPSNSVAWDGNIKKYKLCTNVDRAANRCTELNDVLDANNVKITDANHNILDSAQSYWSAGSDGSEVKVGGAGSVVPSPAARNVQTYYAANYSALTGPATASAGVPLEVGANAFYTAVSADPTLLGLPSGSTTAEVDTLISWMRGIDAYDADEDGDTTEPRWRMGDILHSRASAITFGCVGGGTCSSTSDPIIKLFVGSNDGTIRMINNYSGVEEWAFMPKEMYNMQYSLSQNADGAHLTGLDNTISFWIRDNNRDGVIDPAEDKVFMFVSMRRGGRNIYGFDATPASTLTTQAGTVTPKLMWVIEGGSGAFTKLGQTWSVPRIARIRYACSGSVCDDGNPNTSDSKSRVVLIFAGGYDPNQDNSIPAPTDTMGNAIYIVDPFTGAHIWSASDSGATLNLPKMKYSISSDLTLLDSDRDGNFDRLYVGDMAGQIWRIDLGTQLAANVLDVGTKGYVFADVGCGSTSTVSRLHDTSGACATGATFQVRRKFFYPPSVAQVIDQAFSDASATYDVVAIGSGDREDPLDLLTTNLAVPPNVAADREAVHNRIYMFRDYNYSTGPAPDSNGSSAGWDAPTPLSEIDLYDATVDTLASSSNTGYTAALADLKAKKGWFIDLKRQSAITVPNGLSTVWVGEKVLARTTLLEGVLAVTTFTPANDTNAATSCQASEGIATEYKVNVLNAAAVEDFTGDGTKERSQQIGGGIPSEVVIVFRPDGTTGLINVGGKGAPPKGTKPPQTNFIDRVYWFER